MDLATMTPEERDVLVKAKADEIEVLLDAILPTTVGPNEMLFVLALQLVTARLLAMRVVSRTDRVGRVSMADAHEGIEICEIAFRKMMVNVLRKMQLEVDP